MRELAALRMVWASAATGLDGGGYIVEYVSVLAINLATLVDWCRGAYRCVGSCGGTRGPRRTACCRWRQEGVFGVRGGVGIIL